ncbi:TPA: ABC-three component system middle component 5, partial [Serratia fonticola]
KVSEEQINFMDFYYLFPNQLKNIDNWPRANSKLAVKINSIKDTYENIENPRRIFFELSILRKNTLAHLFSKGILSLIENSLFLHDDKVPEPLIAAIENDSFRLSMEYEVIANEIPKIPTKGKKGLKAKTNLMEYRYD